MNEGIKVHPRHVIRNLAHGEILKAFTEITHKHELTFGEVIDILGDLIKNEARYLKREEDKLLIKTEEHEHVFKTVLGTYHDAQGKEFWLHVCQTCDHCEKEYCEVEKNGE